MAIARALIRNPEVLLMDEPLSSLDLKLREHMRTELRRLHDEFGHTVICVTHDQAEAMTMSDRIAVMKDGLIEQMGSPDKVYTKPVNTFVAAFLGTPSLNLLPAELAADHKPGLASKAEDNLLDVIFRENAANTSVLAGVRPEDVLIGPIDGDIGPADGGTTLAATIRLIEPTGASKLIFADIWEQTGHPRRIIAMVPGHANYRTSQHVPISFRRGRVMVFDAKTERLVGFA